ncbi:dephospho-CoA kinase [bacterium]|nr:dephospho-CoA kinase [bacterium]MCP5463168.1 dephospho-CoA kinase [bacterium]
MKSLFRIGITGGICSGKNTVASILKELGCEIIDTDQIVHELYAKDELMRREIITVFGGKGLEPSGKINRKKIADIVFSNKNLLRRLNDIVHPRVRKAVDDLLVKLSKNKQIVCVAVLVPLLIENNRQNDFDAVVLVTADKETRIDRCIQRNSLTREEVIARMNNQLDDEEKRKFADYVIDNNGSLESTRESVKNMYNNLVRIIHH